jgi:putative addiction module component (TIGR02574 family)
MTKTLEKSMTRDDVMAMSVDERLDLLELIWNTLEPDDIERTPGHEEELDRRLETFESDKSHGRPWDIVREDILRSLK